MTSYVTETADGTVYDWRHPVYMLRFADSDEGYYLVQSLAVFNDGGDVKVGATLYPIPHDPSDEAYLDAYYTVRLSWENVVLIPVFGL